MLKNFLTVIVMAKSFLKTRFSWQLKFALKRDFDLVKSFKIDNPSAHFENCGIKNLATWMSIVEFNEVLIFQL